MRKDTATTWHERGLSASVRLRMRANEGALIRRARRTEPWSWHDARRARRRVECRPFSGVWASRTAGCGAASAREQQSIQLEFADLRAEVEQALAAQERERAAKEEALAENERLKRLLADKSGPSGTGTP